MNTYESIRQIYPAFRLRNVSKSLESTQNIQVPMEAIELYSKLQGNIYTIGEDSGTCYISTINEIQSPFVSVYSNSMVECPNIAPGKKVKYIQYIIHPDVYSALKILYLKENALKFPFFNSYVTEFIYKEADLDEEDPEVEYENLLDIAPNYDLDDLYKKIQVIWKHSNNNITFQIPNDINKVSFDGSNIQFNTNMGPISYPSNSQVFDVVISKLILRTNEFIPSYNPTICHSTYIL